jgi:Kef-type K+ transport system membrane component KefB
MRRLLVLAVLLGGLQLLEPLGSEAAGSSALLPFGFLVLGAYTVGELASAFGLPKIVGYLVAGAVFGPEALAVVPRAGVEELDLVSQLAVALIAFLAGAELRWDDVRRDGIKILKLVMAEVGLTFAALSTAMFLLAPYVPVLSDLPRLETAAFALLFGSVAAVHSPAVTMALLSETGARGPVARTTLGVVLVSDVVVVLLFSATLALARSLVAPAAGVPALSVGALLWEMGGALLVGGFLGAGVALYLRFVGRDLMLFAVLAVFFGLEITRALHVEMLLTLLVAGFVTENVGQHGDDLREAMERSAAPLFVVFFALSGAKIDLAAAWALLPFVIPLALVRAGAIRAGVHLASRWAGVSDLERRHVWMGLVSQAGVAIGLAAVVAEAYPEKGVPMASLILALIAVNETIGPILFRRALAAAGEVAILEEPSEVPVGG